MWLAGFGGSRVSWGGLGPLQPLETQLQGVSPEIQIPQAPGAPKLAPWPCSPEDLPQPSSRGPESGGRGVSAFMNTRLFKVSAEAWTPTSSWHQVHRGGWLQGCLLPRSQVPPAEQGLEHETPSGSLVYSWPRGGGPCAHPPHPQFMLGVEPPGTADPPAGR